MFNYKNIRNVNISKFIPSNVINEIIIGRYSKSSDNNTIKTIDITNINIMTSDDFLAGYNIELEGHLNNGILFNLGKQISNNIDVLNSLVTNNDYTSLSSIYCSLINFLSSIFYSNLNLSLYYLFCEPHDIKNMFIYSRRTPLLYRVKNTYNNIYGNIREIDVYTWILNSVTNDKDFILKGNYREYILGSQTLKIFFIGIQILNSTMIESIRSTIKNNISNSYIYENIYTPGGFLIYINGEEYILWINTIDNIQLYYNILNTLNLFKNKIPSMVFDFRPISIFEYSSNVNFDRNLYANNNYIHFTYSRNIYVSKFINRRINNSDTIINVSYYNNQSSTNNNDTVIIKCINPISREEEFYNISDTTFLNNLGISMGNYLLDINGYDYISKSPILLAISKEYNISNILFQDIRYVLGGAVPINNDELINKKNYDYTNLFSLTIVNPPLSNQQYNYGRNFIEVHKYIRNLNYTHTNWSILSGNVLIFKPNIYNCNIGFSNNVIVFPMPLSINLFNCMTNTDTTNFFNNNFSRSTGISNVYYTLFGYKYDNYYVNIDLYKNDVYNGYNFYILLSKGIMNYNLSFQDFKSIIYDNFIDSFMDIFKNDYSIDCSTILLNNNIIYYNNFLGDTSIYDTIYIPSENEISLYLDGTDVISSKGKSIVISYGQKLNDLNNIFEYERNAIYIKDGTNSTSFSDYMDNMPDNRMYIVIGIGINQITGVFKIYNFLYNVLAIRNYYSFNSLYKNSIFNNLFNLYLNDYFCYNTIPVIFILDKNSSDVEIFYPGINIHTFQIDNTNSINLNNTIILNKQTFTSDKYLFIPGNEGLYMYIIRENEIQKIYNIYNNFYNISNLYYADMGLFGFNYIPTKNIKNRIGVWRINA